MYIQHHYREAEILYNKIKKIDSNFEEQYQLWQDLIPINIQPIAFVYNNQYDKYEAPRQSGYDIIKEEVTNVQSLQDLKLQTNKNYYYRNKCLPPKLMNKRVGFMSSRTPNRFNPIGQSIGKCISQEYKNNIYNYNFIGLDLLNNTPIIHFKEYEKQYQVKNATFGWCQDENLLPFYYDEQSNIQQLNITNINQFKDKIEFIQQHTKIPVKEFIINNLQIKHNLSRSHKIVQRDTSRVLACGQFRIEYIVQNKEITIMKIYPSMPLDIVEKCRLFDRDCNTQWLFYQQFQQ